ncbi:glycosyltransferase 87 family protein [Tessaracoccus rhinocerotis]|nr:glycosyltransferase 87 family protein [Tessaracoccus rhinocerotis]
MTDQPAEPATKTSARSWVGWLVAASTALVVLLLAQPVGLDLKVYREGARIALQGGQGLYAPYLGPVGDPGLPFTYPPFAALLFAPLALVPFEATYVVMTALSVTLIHLVSCRIMDRLRAAGRFGRVPAWALTPFLLISAPFLDTLTYGQVNVILLAACYLTASQARWPWLFGVAVGVTAGVKLTPLALLLLPLALWKWRTILVAGATFAGTQLLGLLVFPAQSVEYWGHVIWDPTRVGATDYIDNLSLRGILERAGFGFPAWAVAVGLAIVLAGVAIYRARDQLPEQSLGFAAGCMLLISPVSWVHHFVWWPVIASGWAPSDRRATSGSLGAAALRKIALALLILPLVASPKILMKLAGVDETSIFYIVGVVLSALPAVGILLGTAINAFRPGRGEQPRAEAG